MEQIKNQPCPMCHKKTLTLTEDEQEIPFFGKCYIFSMNCKNCKYNISDVEAVGTKEPSRYTFEITSEKDMKVRLIKSSTATLKIPKLRMVVKPGTNSIGYISNIEGAINRFQKIIEQQKNTTDDDKVKKSAKNLLKKIIKVKRGDIPVKIIIEDPKGNSAIISDKAKIETLKVKRGSKKRKSK